MSDKVKVKGNKIVVKINREGHIYKGSARCHPNDQFDGVVGSELALARAEIKYKQEKMSVLDYVLAPIQSKLAELEKEIAKYEELEAKFMLIAGKTEVDLLNLVEYEEKMSSLND